MFSDSVLRTISEISQMSILLPILLVCFGLRKWKGIFKIVAILIVCSGIISFIAYRYYVNAENNMFLLHGYTIIEYGLWTAIYYHVFHTKMQRKLLIGLLLVFTTFSITNTVLWQPLTVYNSYSRSAEGFLLMCFSIAWFYKVFSEGRIAKLEAFPFFWINAAVLLYFSGAFLLFVSNNFMLALARKQLLEAWALHGIFLILHYTFISIGLWLKLRKKISH